MRRTVSICVPKMFKEIIVFYIFSLLQKPLYRSFVSVGFLFLASASFAVIANAQSLDWVRDDPEVNGKLSAHFVHKDSGLTWHKWAINRFPFYRRLTSNNFQFQRSIAIVVGIGDYEYWQPLGGPLADASRMRDFLKNQAGFDEVFLITDREVTRERIDWLLAYAARRLEPNDRFLFYWSGHGGTLEGVDANGFLPFSLTRKDGGGDRIGMREINARLQSIRARHQLAIIDACFSSNAFSIEEKGRIADILSEPASIILASSAQDEYSYGIDPSVSSSDTSGGFLTSAFLNAVGANGQEKAADFDNNGFITMTEVMSAVSNELTEISAAIDIKQTPRLRRIGSGTGDFFFLSRKTWLPEDERVFDGKIISYGKGNGCESAEDAWDIVKVSHNKQILQNFVNKFSGCPVTVAHAQQRIEEISESADLNEINLEIVPSDSISGGRNKPDSPTYSRSSQRELDECKSLVDGVTLADLRVSEKAVALRECKEALSVQAADDVDARSAANALVGKLHLASGSYSLALDSFKAAADLGNTYAMLQLASMLSEGLGLPRDAKRAFEWTLAAARAGSSFAMGRVGWMYHNGIGVPQDYLQAAQWYAQANERGELWTVFNLGLLYRFGNGVPENHPEARRLFRIAAEGGDSNGMRRLGYMLIYGQGGNLDRRAGLDWLRRAAKLGDVEAMTNLSYYLFEGKQGIDGEVEEAVRWERAAAEAGSAWGMFNFGYSYLHGRWAPLIPQSNQTAFNWFQESAAKGNSRAMRYLGNMYARGLAVERDLDAAVDWYLASVASGGKWIIENGRNLDRATIAQLQGRLSQDGFYGSEIDGIAGNATRTALLAYQEAKRGK